MQKMTQREKNERIAKLTNYKMKLERGEFCGEVDYSIKDRIYYFTNVFLKIPQFEQIEVKKSWDTYYKKRLSEDKRPSGFDPMEWDHCDWAIAWKGVVKKLNELQAPEDVEWSQAVGDKSW